MLRPYNELRKIDVLPHCEYREAKDDKGKKITVPYLNWAKCVDLLHENGAEKVYYEPLYNDKGHSVFMADIEFTDKNGNINRCYEVRIKTVVDDESWTTNYPLMNGAYVVRNDTINQLRVSTAQARAFVKGVALHTGLGFGLWIKSDEERLEPVDDLQYHNIFAIKKRVEETLTSKMQRGMDYKDVLSGLGINDKQLKSIMKSFDTISVLENKLKSL